MKTFERPRVAISLAIDRELPRLGSTNNIFTSIRLHNRVCSLHNCRYSRTFRSPNRAATNLNPHRWCTTLGERCFTTNSMIHWKIKLYLDAYDNTSPISVCWPFSRYLDEGDSASQDANDHNHERYRWLHLETKRCLLLSFILFERKHRPESEDLGS